MHTLTMWRARRRPRVPILTTFYALAVARAWREEVRGR